MIEKDEVVRWLEETGLEYTEEDLGEEFAWGVSYASPGGFTAIAGQRQVEWNELVMQVSLNVAPEHQEVLRALEESARAEFLFDLRIALLQKPAGYRLEFEGGEEGILKRAVVGYLALEDPLQKAGFFRRSHQIQSSITLFVQFIQKLARFQRWP